VISLHVWLADQFYHFNFLMFFSLVFYHKMATKKEKTRYGIK